MGGIRTHELRQTALAEKAQWDLTQKSLHTMLSGLLMKRIVLVVCTRARCVLLAPFPIHCSTGLKYTEWCHSIPLNMTSLSATQKKKTLAEKLDRVQSKMRVR